MVSSIRPRDRHPRRSRATSVAGASSKPDSADPARICGRLDLIAQGTGSPLVIVTAQAPSRDDFAHAKSPSLDGSASAVTRRFRSCEIAVPGWRRKRRHATISLMRNRRPWMAAQAPSRDDFAHAKSPSLAFRRCKRLRLPTSLARNRRHPIQRIRSATDTDLVPVRGLPPSSPRPCGPLRRLAPRVCASANASECLLGHSRTFATA